MASEFDEIIRWLSTPAAYPHAPESVARIETHISCVFLAGEHVFKLKKPVRYDFLDFSTLGGREHACREELRLNRRLAPATYLDVVPITRSAAGELQIGGDGQPLDWLVHMRRLPTDQTLEVLHRSGELQPKQIDRLAGVLVDFYKSLASLPISADEYRQRVEAHVRGNRRELMSVAHHLPPNVVERVHAFQLQLLKLRPEIFEVRVNDGRIVDGHGDLRPEHICLSNPPAIFDCIEFSADFRRLDVADELAFLAAECDFLGAEWVGPRLLTKYGELSGDQPPEVLLAFYKSYRACVRAKVAALRANQLSGGEREAAATEALGHLKLADRYIEPWARPLVLIVGGLSGTGKSTLAAAVAETLGVELLRTDVIREELFTINAEPTGLDQGIYRPELRRQVYDEMLLRAARMHAEGVSVVLDGTFAETALLEAARNIATQPRAHAFGVQCVCRPDVAQARIRKRLEQGGDASQARPETHDLQRQRWEAWPADLPQTCIDTAAPLDTQVQKVIASLSPLWLI